MTDSNAQIKRAVWCCWSGKHPEFQYPGRSVVVDPHGVIIADAGAQERVCSAVFERAVLEGWRADFPALRDAGF
jgi:omega-amidase